MKFTVDDVTDIAREVAPFTGAWIEMGLKSIGYIAVVSRTLHGCVD